MENIPQVDLEEFEIPEDEDISIEDKSGGSLKIGFIGAGQCGSRIADAFFNLGYTKNIVINTTEQDMAGVNVPNKMIITMEGLTGGAGKDMDLAEKIINSNKEDIYNKITELFGKVDHIFVCAGLGGGTGGGSVLTLLDVAKKYMDYMGFDDASKKVGAIVTLPTHGEANSPLVAANALEMGKKLSAKADKNNISPLIVIDNDKVKRLYKGLTVDSFFPTINNSVAQLLNIFNVISVGSSEYVTFDATDFQSVIEAGGHLIMGVSTVKEFESITSIADALRKNLMKTLLASDFDLSTAKAAGVVVIGGKEEFATVAGLMDNIEFGFDAITAITGNAKVHRGIYSDENRNGRISVYTLISGLKAPDERYKKIKKNVFK